jgi:hypothetical protein
MKASLDNLPLLIDEIKQAAPATDLYSEGYLDGLHMALSILEGLTD